MGTSSICISTGSQASALFSITPNRKIFSSFTSDSLSRLFATRVRVTIGDDKRGIVHVNYGETFETRRAVIVAVDTSYPHLWSAGASNNTVTGCDVTVVSASDSAGVSVWVCLIAAEF